MKKTYFIFMSGIIVGLLIQQYIIKDEMGVGGYLYLVVMTGIFSNDKLWDFFVFLFLTSYVLVIPFTWVNGDIRWYEPLVVMFIIFSLVRTLFFRNKVNTPIFVELGDVVRFNDVKNICEEVQ